MTHTETIRTALNCADADLEGIQQRAELGTAADKEDLRAARCTRADIKKALKSLDKMVDQDDLVKKLRNILRLMDGCASPDHADPIGDGVESLHDLARSYET